MNKQMIETFEQDLQQTTSRLEEVSKECERLNEALITTQNERDELGSLFSISFRFVIK